MKKKIKSVTTGYRADIGPHEIYRIVPSSSSNSIGPFVFLDYLPLKKHTTNKPLTVPGTGAHPHRGIATLTYTLKGEVTHYDSRGNVATIHSGGLQWMKAGNGIIHDEVIDVDSQTSEKATQGFQFWINLPSTIKEEDPEYRSIQANDVPLLHLNEDSGWLKVIVGEYQGLQSIIPNYSRQFLYHINLAAAKQFTLLTDDQLEVAAFAYQDKAIVNDKELNTAELVVFEKDEGIVEIRNPFGHAIDIILFGGEKYAEPIIAQGPFVMNTHEEIVDAYEDFYNGKYGQIKY